MFYVYVLKCSNINSGAFDFYTGFSSDLKQRISEHKSGGTITTKKFDNIELIYYEACLNEKDARQREKQLKTGFGRGYLKRRLENYLKN